MAQIEDELRRRRDTGADLELDAPDERVTDDERDRHRQGRVTMRRNEDREGDRRGEEEASDDERRHEVPAPEPAGPPRARLLYEGGRVEVQRRSGRRRHPTIFGTCARALEGAEQAVHSSEGSRRTETTHTGD